MATRANLVQETPATGEPLHIKYRPKTLKGVWGQDETVRSLTKLLEGKNVPHAFLFSGPAGCGKTTLARIVGTALGVLPENTREIDAASNSGIDDMRAVTENLRYLGFGSVSRKLVVIDECHGLSKNAWDSLLKTLEEPPDHVYFALCTTNLAKVPDTIASRCVSYKVKQLGRDDMLDMLELVCKDEGLDVPTTILDEVEKASEGSPRRALTALASVLACKDAKEAALILSQPFETEDVIELCRDLISGKLKWSRVREILGGRKDEDPEGIRLVVVNYIQAVLLKTDDSGRAQDLLDHLSQFMRPITNRSEKMAPLLIAFANCIWK